MIQLEIAQVRNVSCPYSDLTDDNDTHCNNNGMAPKGYVPLGEDSEDHELQLASVGGPYLDDISALDQSLPTLPPYIPVVTHGSKKLFENFTPEWVGVQLGEVLSGKVLRTPNDMRNRLGVPPATKVVLLAYGLDSLIENLWQRRRVVLKKLAELGFDLVTAVNYSIWDMHPHPERIFNVKRSLVTYEELQEFGAVTVPHVYWYGAKSMQLWATWLRRNAGVRMVAIDMQTLRRTDWDRHMVELAQFVAMVGRPLHFLVTGPQTAERVRQVKNIAVSVTLTNTYPAIMAWSFRGIQFNGNKISFDRSVKDKSTIMKENVAAYERLAAA